MSTSDASLSSEEMGVPDNPVVVRLLDREIQRTRRDLSGFLIFQGLLFVAVALLSGQESVPAVPTAGGLLLNGIPLIGLFVAMTCLGTTWVSVKWIRAAECSRRLAGGSRPMFSSLMRTGAGSLLSPYMLTPFFFVLVWGIICLEC